MSERGGMPASERQALLILNALEGWGPISARKALDWAEGRWQTLFECDAATLGQVVGKSRAAALVNWDRGFDVAREEAELAQRGARFVTCRDPDYPARLKTLSDAPLCLYWHGPALVPEKAIAVVGTRHATTYGKKVARQFTRELVNAGFTIVSGLAMGIDAEAHRSALDAGGSTLGVLGSGLDIVYPAANASLFSQMRERGALISEFPLHRRPDRQSFPQRNRVVSGMTVATIVVETGKRGGSLITAKFAMEQNRTVFAVPGRLDQPHSRGCLDLIRDGATLLTSVDEVIEELSFMQLDLSLGNAGPAGGSQDRLSALGEEERSILMALDGGETLHLDQLCERTGLPTFQLQSALMMLELQRLVLRGPGGTYEASL